MSALPRIIQGGMGAGISGWELARAVSSAGQLGVVSGTGIEMIMARRLQAGDEGGHLRRALAAFPDQRVAARVLGRYLPGDHAGRRRLRLPRPHRLDDSDELLEDTIAANFAEVWLAREGHDRPVGLNLLTKIQVPTLASLYGAMLAGVDVVIMGAGIPREVPAILDALADGADVSMPVSVEGAHPGEEYRIALEPRRLVPDAPVRLERPLFFPIVSSNLLATVMVRKASGRVDGLVVEGPSAGGHNAPPRAGMLDANGEPVYGPKDEVALDRVAELGVPFYLAGGYGDSGRLRDALAAGAAGIQVGTAFAFCRESALMRTLKESALGKAAREMARVVTDRLASPTGFPFKVLSLEGTLSELREYLARPRACNLGLLRSLYRKDDGEVGYRCPAEPEASWAAKGGAPDQTEGRKCLCNALLANLGLGLEQPGGYREPPLLTVGSAFERIRALLRPDGEPYTARDVIAFLLGELAPAK